MEIYFYKAECGDASRIRFLGEDGKYRNLFIDAGFRRTFRDILKKEVKAIKKSKEEIDLWVISHIHDDHIGGIEQYIKDIKSGELKDIVNKWLYNSPRDNVRTTLKHLESISVPKSIRQGDLVTSYLMDIKKLPTTDIVKSTHIHNLSGLSYQILSPSKEKLQKLRDKYVDKGVALEKMEGDISISEAKSRIKDDYHLKLMDFDLSEWDEDNSVENGSSITLLTEFDNKKILWLADAHPSDVVKSLKQLKYSKTNKVVCDWVKVTHHGSKANNSNDLYDLIECSNYLFSADGVNKHKLPTKESISRILRNSNRDLSIHYKLHFTYDNVVLRTIFEEEDESVYSQLNFSVEYLKGKDCLEVSLD